MLSWVASEYVHNNWTPCYSYSCMTFKKNMSPWSPCGFCNSWSLHITPLLFCVPLKWCSCSTSITCPHRGTCPRTARISARFHLELPWNAWTAVSPGPQKRLYASSQNIWTTSRFGESKTCGFWLLVLRSSILSHSKAKGGQIQSNMCKGDGQNYIWKMDP